MRVEIYHNKTGKITLHRLKYTTFTRDEKFKIFANNVPVYIGEVKTDTNEIGIDLVSKICTLCESIHTRLDGYTARPIRPGDTVVISNDNERRVFLIDVYTIIDATEYFTKSDAPPVTKPSKITIDAMIKFSEFNLNEVSGIDFFYDKRNPHHPSIVDIDEDTYNYIIQERKRRGW